MFGLSKVTEEMKPSYNLCGQTRGSQETRKARYGGSASSSLHCPSDGMRENHRRQSSLGCAVRSYGAVLAPMKLLSYGRAVKREPDFDQPSGYDAPNAKRGSVNKISECANLFIAVGDQHLPCFRRGPLNEMSPIR